MNIKIKRIGYHKGTVGWLAAGLQDGSLQIIEGRMKKSGNHGLWLKGPEQLRQFMAAHNRYNLSILEYDKADRYEPCGDEDRGPFLTDACWQSLRQIAREWCDLCNAERDQDKPEAFHLSRIAVAETTI